jgi:ribosomal-protein-alanine N-acetyltransferase
MLFDALPESDHPDVALRPVTADDLPVWLALLHRPEVYEHTSWNHPSAEDIAHNVWSDAMRSDPAHRMRLAIARRDSGRLVGTIGFPMVTPLHRSVEIAYELSPEFWGRGIATQLCRLLVAWVHEHANVLRVQAAALQSNARSLRVLERAGFEREGLLRSYRLVRGTPSDFFMYSHVACVAQ